MAAIGAAHRPHGASGSVDLAILGTVWLLVLVVLSHPARVWIPAALLVFAVHGALLIRDGGVNPLSLSQLEAAGYIIAAILIAFAALRPTLAMHVSMAARRASLASRSAAERAAAAAIQQERQSRLAVLEQEALPLLRGIADGTLDPADERRARAVRPARGGTAALPHRRARRAAAGLVAGLEPALRAARARGLPVTVQVIGDPGLRGRQVARAVLAAVDAVLSALPPHQVMLTVLASGDDVELYLTFSAPLRAAPDLTRFGLDLPAAARWHAACGATETGGGCLEVSWRKDGAALTGVIDVAAVDDHPIILDSVAGWVMADEGDIRVVATAATVDALLAGPGRRADVVLLDLDLGDGTTVDAQRGRHPRGGPGGPGPVGVRPAARRPGGDARRRARVRPEERAGQPDTRGDQGGCRRPGLDLPPPRLHLRHR